MTNFEIKIGLELNSIKKIENLLKKMGASYEQDIHQIDHYLKIGESKEKIREIVGKEIQQIIYHRNEFTGRKKSRYEIKILSKKEKDELLKKVNVLCKVEKSRRLWIYKHTRIHIDNVIGLGYFLELETVVKSIPLTKGVEEFNKMIKALKLNVKDGIPCSYSEMILKKQKDLSPFTFQPKGLATI